MADCRYFPECQRGNEVGDLWIPCIGGADGIRCEVYEPMPDVDELAKLADEMSRCAWYFGLDFDEDEPLRDRLKEASEDFAECALRIREALGVSDD